MQMYTIQQPRRSIHFIWIKAFQWKVSISVHHHHLNQNLQARHLEEIAGLRIEVKQLRNSQNNEEQQPPPR